ncbi:hypothetical protein D3C79_893080 [compost metagenome]
MGDKRIHQFQPFRQAGQPGTLQTGTAEPRRGLQVAAVVTKQGHAQLLYPAPVHVGSRRMSQLAQFIAQLRVFRPRARVLARMHGQVSGKHSVSTFNQEGSIRCCFR